MATDLLYTGRRIDGAEAFAREGAEQERLRRTEDWREGVKAMAEHRPPNFTGS